VASGCAFESAPISGPQLSHAINDADAATEASPPPGTESFGNAGDATAEPVGALTTSDAAAPPPPAADDAAGAGASDAGPSAPAQPDAGPSEDKPADAAIDPPKGGLLEPCTMDEGCAGELVCYGAPGFCAQPCDKDHDCTPLDGFEYSCSDNVGACRIDCGDDDGDGRCPDGFECSFERCMPGMRPGGGDRGLLEPCDRSLGDDDCIQGLVCYRWNDTQQDSPGYCTLPCGEGAGNGVCDVPMQGEFEFSCGGEGGCRFSCSNAPCPSFMQCEQLSGQGGRCHYPRGSF
jgi:hypothetical protein